jgi:hypothetical protein
MMDDRPLSCDIVQVSRKILNVIVQSSYQAYSREFWLKGLIGLPTLKLEQE